MRFNLNIVYYFNWKIEILWRRRKIKIKVEDLTLIFENVSRRLLLYLRKGFKRRNSRRIKLVIMLALKL
jgi:hypothetical protein